MIDTTQNHLPIQDIHDDVLVLKDGTMAVVIQTSAVNFGLLSENEQLAIISAFAGLLNSLSFMIQIVIRSKRLDISSYLKLLDEARTQQKNPLLSEMIYRYRGFIESTIRENDVLDKKFYIVIPVSYLELGIIKNIEGNLQKGLTLLMPRRDHIIRQLSRIGLRATQLNTKDLIMLFYDVYNDSTSYPANLPEQTPVPEPVQRQETPVQLPAEKTLPAPYVQPVNEASSSPKPTYVQPYVQQPPPLSQSQSQPIQTWSPQPTMQQAEKRAIPNSGPFVVEELEDDYGVVK